MPTPEALAWARLVLTTPASSGFCRLPPAGSPRTLTRLLRPEGSVVLVEHPVPLTESVNENDSFVYLAEHLGARAIPVPRVLAYERSRGWTLVEDLGDRDLCHAARVALHGTAAADPVVRARIAALYRQALDVLVRLQLDGAEGFDANRTHNPPRYDATLMREWESGYFLRELIVHHLRLSPPVGLEIELDRLAARAVEAGTEHLLHRDYQSQNLKIRGGRVFVIDFQGARLGPPQYDLASLLLDPYADLPQGLRGELLEHYLGQFSARTGEDRGRFVELLPAVAAHRLMQALGAYALLGLRRGKPAFLAHIPVALRLLEETLAPLADATPRLVALVAEARRATGGGPDGQHR